MLCFLLWIWCLEELGLECERFWGRDDGEMKKWGFEICNPYFELAPKSILGALDRSRK
ncbi:hypothetical protein LguiB_027145 [Lonicera macranthoides]